MSKERDLLQDAISATENEIFGDAFGKEDVTLDESGDRTLEAMGDGLEGQHEAEDEEDEGEAEPEGEAEEQNENEDGETDPKSEQPPAQDRQPAEPQGRVPAGRLREEAEARRAAESERDAAKALIDQMRSEHQRAQAESNARLEAILVSIRQGQQPQNRQPPQPEGPPNMFEDPQGYHDYVQRQVDQRIAAIEENNRLDRVNWSMEMSRSRHGETFDKAFQALTSLNANDPRHRAFVQQMMSEPNPGEAVINWHKRSEALREIGEDPAAYKARVADETRKALLADENFRKEVLKSMRAEAETGGEGGTPRSSFRLPPSLGRTSGGNNRAPNDLDSFDGSQEAIFNSAW